MIKNSFKSGKTFFSILLILAAAAGSHAETFRVRKAHIVRMNSALEPDVPVKAGTNDAVAVFIPEDRTFIEGIEIKMEIPESVASWRDSVACSVYTGIKPVPSAQQIDYSGTRAFVGTLPARLSWIFQIPLRREHRMKSNQYTTPLGHVLHFPANVIFLRLQPVMKGVPEETMNAQISMTVKPVLINKGRLEMSLVPPDGELLPCSVFIDDEPVKFSGTSGSFILDTGVHNISVISDSYRSEIRTVRIDKAQTISLPVEMKSIEPTLIITAPEGTEITLDGEKQNLTGHEFKISEGEHTLQFAIGDYQIVRSISAIKGKTYRADFSVSLEVTEE